LERLIVVDSKRLKLSLSSICVAIAKAASELNALDGQLGDGDLGVTLDKCAGNIVAAIPSMNDDLSANLQAAALACAKASGSSFGTLLSQALLVSARKTVNRSILSRLDVAALLLDAITVLSARGGAKLGDKTVLDAMDAAARALQGATVEDLRTTAIEAVEEAILAFRDKPNKIGRARMFANRSIGLDDPGMIAFLRMLQAA
jgi:dihydroxyacetone kinase-like protein